MNDLKSTFVKQPTLFEYDRQSFIFKLSKTTTQQKMVLRSLVLVLFLLCMLTSCQSSKGSTEVVKPRYHHTWYKKHTYKRKWHIGRLYVHPEKQGVKKVKMKN